MNDETKFLVVSPLNNDQNEMNNIDEFIIQKYRDDYVETTEENNVLFKYSEELKQKLKNEIDTPILTNIASLSIGDYKYDDSTAEWVEIKLSDPIFEHGQDLEKQNIDSQDNQREDQQEHNVSNQIEEYDDEDDIPEHDEYGSHFSSDLNQEQNDVEDQADYDNNQDEDQSEDIDYTSTTYNNEQAQNQSQLVSKIDDQSQNTYDKSLESEDVLKDLVKELLPDSREIIDRINTNLNVQDSFDNPMSTIVRIIHNSTLQQLYSRVEDKVYELNDSRVDDSIDEYRNKVINQPPQILQDLKDEEIQFREVSKNISSEVNKIQSNYDRELENYVREVGERARIEAEEQAKKEYVAQNESYTQNQINEYVDSMSDTYNSLEASLSEMKDRVARSLINEFIYESHNPALSAALRFIKDKQDLEKRAQNDIDAINQSTQNAQLINQQNYDDDLLDPGMLEMSDDEFDQDDFDDNESEDYAFDNDEFDQDDDDDDYEDLDDEESQEDNDEMSDDSIADSLNQFNDEDSNEESDLNTDEFGLDENLNEQDNDSDEENDEQLEEDVDTDSGSDEENDEESEEDDEKKLDENLDEGGAAEEDELESDEELNEFNDDEINIITPESDSEDEDEHQDSPEVDNEDGNKKLTHTPKSKFRESIEGNPYDNEDEDDEVDELRDDFNDQTNQNDESIKDDIIEDQNDVDTGKDLDEISQDNDDNKNKKSKKSKIIMGIIIALVVAIVIAFAALFLVNELSDDNSQQNQKQEQQAKKDHDQYLKDLKTYMLGSTQTVQMGDQTIKVKIVQINKDGSVEAEYKEKNKDGEIVKKRKTIEKPVIESALKKQKKKANKKENQTIDDSK